MLPVLPDHPLARIALWHVDGLQQPGMTPELWLTQRERSDAAEFGNEHRRREWIACRIALKRLIIQDNIIRSPLHAEIRKDERGCPHVHVNDPDNGYNAVFSCSLAHKNVLVCAAYALSGAAIGIDIERRSWRLHHIRKRFESPRDQLLESADSIGRYTTLWAFKEAASKLLGLGYAAGFSRIHCAETEPNVCTVQTPDDTLLQGNYVWVGKYVIALVTEPCPIPHAIAIRPAIERPWIEQWRRARRLSRLRRLRAVAAKAEPPLDDPLDLT